MLETAIEESRSAGRVVVVAGEAGIGKTALVSALADRHRVLWGACDPLITPRPMGPLRDVARQAGGALAEAVEGSREDLLSAVLDELRAPAALVIEDLHWADDATLDFVALLGRRLPRSRGCLVVTCRPDVRDGGAARARPRCRASACARSSPARSRRRRSRCWRGARAATPPTCTPPPAATRSSSPRCWRRPPATACRRACATRSRCARRPRGRRRTRSRSWPPCSRARPSWRS